MKILIITQKVDLNDQVLGFFHRWLEEFSSNFENVKVICLERGEFNLPHNVQIYSLGKEVGCNRFNIVWNFIKNIIFLRKDYDVVLVHMNPIYIILGGIFWKLMNKRVSLWYTHSSVDLKLRIAEKFVNYIFTASSKSLRIKTGKKVVTGHGIDTKLFSPKENIFKKDIILTVGRISKTKNIIDMLDLLNDNNFILKIIGKPITNFDERYFEELLNKIKNKGLSDRVIFVGSVKQEDLPDYYSSSKVFVNFSTTGSADKAVLESLSMNLPVYTTNNAFLDDDFPVFNSFNEALCSNLDTRSFIIENHSLESLIPKIANKI